MKDKKDVFVFVAVICVLLALAILTARFVVLGVSVVIDQFRAGDVMPCIAGCGMVVLFGVSLFLLVYLGAKLLFGDRRK